MQINLRFSIGFQFTFNIEIPVLCKFYDIIHSKYILYRNLSLGTMTGKIWENVMFMM